mmetsp:Transcript_99527/g.277018  ORF Transcript_99527/g.277018 Transcript_99527/m.277018 type:complete len:208 (-) Transcript_99527:368-991(-)
MCREEVLSRWSSWSLASRSFKSWRCAFSCAWWCVRSLCERKVLIWCSWILVDTGSWMCSRVARCLRLAAQELALSVGSSRALICALVSAMVSLVRSISPRVSLISFSRRPRIAWFSAQRSWMLRSTLAMASSAIFWQRAMSCRFSSRSAWALCSRLLPNWHSWCAFCCRFISFLVVSCNVKRALVALCAGTVAVRVMWGRTESLAVW